MELDELGQLRAPVERAVRVAKERVEQLADRPRQGRGGHHQRPDEVGTAAADGEAEARADGLRHDLAKDQDGRDGHQDGDHGVGHGVKKDGQRLHADGVGEQQRDEEPVPPAHERQEPRRAAALGGRAAADEDRQCVGVEREQAERQARHEARAQRQRNADANVRPEQRARRLDVVCLQAVQLARADHLGWRRRGGGAIVVGALQLGGRNGAKEQQQQQQQQQRDGG